MMPPNQGNMLMAALNGFNPRFRAPVEEETQAEVYAKKGAGDAAVDAWKTVVNAHEGRADMANRAGMQKAALLNALTNSREGRAQEDTHFNAGMGWDKEKFGAQRADKAADQEADRGWEVKKLDKMDLLERYKATQHAKAVRDAAMARGPSRGPAGRTAPDAFLEALDDVDKNLRATENTYRGLSTQEGWKRMDQRPLYESVAALRANDDLRLRYITAKRDGDQQELARLTAAWRAKRQPQDPVQGVPEFLRKDGAAREPDAYVSPAAKDL